MKAPSTRTDDVLNTLLIAVTAVLLVVGNVDGFFAAPAAAPATVAGAAAVQVAAAPAR